MVQDMLDRYAALGRRERDLTTSNSTFLLARSETANGCKVPIAGVRNAQQTAE
jgi:hypothetical protein